MISEGTCIDARPRDASVILVNNQYRHQNAYIDITTPNMYGYGRIRVNYTKYR
jgi:hypothetical protein